MSGYSLHNFRNPRTVWLFGSFQGNNFRRADDYSQGPSLSERVGHAVGVIFVRGIEREVLERQNGDRFDARCEHLRYNGKFMRRSRSWKRASDCRLLILGSIR